MPDVLDLLAMAQTTAVTAGAIIREKLHQPRQISSKGFRDFVTDADFAAQTSITNAIRHRWPDHGFLTEEEDGALPTTGPIIWVIDPVDGTINFSRTMPLFCVSVAAMQPGSDGDLPDVLAGVIYDPMRDELFSAAKGQGAWVKAREDGEKRPLHVSPIHDLSESLLTHDWSHVPAWRQKALAAITHLAPTVYNIRAGGSAALALAWLAAGRAEAYFNFSLKPWDLAAATLLLTEAGGQLTTTRGAPLVWSTDGVDCLASNGRVHHSLVNMMNGGKL
jgi:myo-inositol-1(or 4)-monophosphatase